MQRTILALFLLACLPGEAASDALRFEYRISKLHALVNFIETISGIPHRSHALGDIYNKSRFHTAHRDASLSDYEQIKKIGNQSFPFPGYPTSRKMLGSVQKILLAQATFSDSLEDYETRLSGWLPASEQNLYLRLLHDWLPIYETLIWDPNLEKLNDYRKRMEAFSTQAKLNHLFEKAAKFYGSSWPSGIPFVIALYPIPGSEGDTSAESNGNMESVGVLLEDKDLALRFGVIFHELCHSLYTAQSAEWQLTLEDWFFNSTSPYAAYAYRTWNEALASALGNGWAFAEASGALDTRAWYDDDYIDGFAKALYPLVVTYLKAGKKLDHAFVKSSIEKYASLFPEAPFEYENLMRDVVLLTEDGMDTIELGNQLENTFSVSNLASFPAIDDPQGYREWFESRDTLVLVISNASSAHLRRLLKPFPELKKFAGALIKKKGTYAFTTLGTDGRPYVVLKVVGGAPITSLLERLKRKAKFEGKSSFL